MDVAWGLEATSESHPKGLAETLAQDKSHRWRWTGGKEVGVVEKRTETFLDVCRSDDRNYR